MKTIRRLCATSLAASLFLASSGTPPAVTGAEPGPSGTAARKAVVYGKLVTLGDRAISVNGNSVRSGATIISGARLETPTDVSASLQLWPLGRLEIAPRTTLQLEYGEDRISVNLLNGCLVLTTYAGVEGTLNLPQGVTQHTGPKANDFIDVCTSEAGAAPLIGLGAAVKAGAGTCWAGAALPAASGFNPLFLLGAAPLAVAGFSAINNDGRPPAASPSGL